jgi:nucleoside-diphosphate-sugar epimerase
MTVLITGAGLIGAHIARELQMRGVDVVLYDVAPATDYLSTVLDLDRARVVAGDITNLPELAALVQHYRVEQVVHTAALIGAQVAQQPYRGVQVNVDGTIAVMEAARGGGVKRLIFCSSMAIYDFDRLPPGARIAEDAPLGPKNLYGATKLACEQLLNQYGAIYKIDVIHLRLAGVYGRGQFVGGSWMGRILNRALEASLAGKSVTLKSEWLGTNEYVYVKDVARALAAACLTPNLPSSAYNIGTGVLHTFAQFVNEICAVLPTAAIETAPPDGAIVSYLERDQAFDISKARRELNYAPQFTFRAGLEDYAHELRNFAGRYARLD